MDRIAQSIANKLYGNDTEPVDYQQRYESLMDELVKLAQKIENHSQESRNRDAGEYAYLYGMHNAYSDALSWLQDVMRNA